MRKPQSSPGGARIIRLPRRPLSRRRPQDGVPNPPEDPGYVAFLRGGGFSG